MRNLLFSLGMAPLFLFLASPEKGDRIISAQPEISIAETRIVEGNSGQKMVEVMITLSQPATAPVKISYSTRAAGASEKTDFIAAEGSLLFNTGDLINKIEVPIVGDVTCEGDEKIEIVISNVSGATISDNVGTVIIVDDDCAPAYPGISDPAIIKRLKIYEVRFTHTGFTTFFTGPGDCPIRSNGVVILTGLLYGMEDVPADDDIEYRGTLQLAMDMDLCSAKRIGGEDKLCGMRVIGSGPVETNLNIYYDQRGGYIKFENRPGSFMRSVTGSCDQAEMDEEKTMIPDKTMASIFNGLELPMLTNRTLVVGRYVETGVNGETVVEVLRKIKP